MTNPAVYLEHFGRTLQDRRWGNWNSYLRQREQRMWSTFQVYAPIYTALIGGLVGWIHYRFDRATGRS